MTLTEIKKVIDEADFCLIRDGDNKSIASLFTQERKEVVEALIERNIHFGLTYTFFKFDDNDEVRKMCIIDRIDKRKKTIKKKLDDMTDSEIAKVRGRICNGRKTCDGCLFAYNKPGLAFANICLSSFPTLKERYLNNKDKEFEIEVEE